MLETKTVKLQLIEPVHAHIRRQVAIHPTDYFALVPFPPMSVRQK
jgi:hypothetical protein